MRRKVRKQEQSLFRVNHFHAAVQLHRSVKALNLRDDIKQQVNKFAVKDKAVIPASVAVMVFKEEEPNSDDDLNVFDAIE